MVSSIGLSWLRHTYCFYCCSRHGALTTLTLWISRLWSCDIHLFWIPWSIYVISARRLTDINGKEKRIITERNSSKFFIKENFNGRADYEIPKWSSKVLCFLRLKLLNFKSWFLWRREKKMKHWSEWLHLKRSLMR